MDSALNKAIFESRRSLLGRAPARAAGEKDNRGSNGKESSCHSGLLSFGEATVTGRYRLASPCANMAETSGGHMTTGCVVVYTALGVSREFVSRGYSKDRRHRILIHPSIRANHCCILSQMDGRHDSRIPSSLFIRRVGLHDTPGPFPPPC